MDPGARAVRFWRSARGHGTAGATRSRRCSLLGWRHGGRSAPGDSRSRCSSWRSCGEVLGAAVIVAYRAWIAAAEAGALPMAPRPPPPGQPGPIHEDHEVPYEREAPAGPLPLPPDPLPARSLFWIAFLLYAFLAAYVTTALSTAGDEHVYLLNVQSLYADRDLQDPEQRRGPGLRAFLLGPRKPGDVPPVHRLSTPPPGYALGSTSCPGIRWAVAWARPSSSGSAPPFWGSRPTGCAGTSASHRSPPSGGGSWWRSRRRSRPTPATRIRRSRGARRCRGHPRAAAPATRRLAGAGDRDRFSRGAGRAQGPGRARRARDFAWAVARLARGRRALALGVLAAAATAAGAACPGSTRCRESSRTSAAPRSCGACCARGTS